MLELRFLRMCAAHGLPRPQVNVRIDEWMPDFYWPEWGLVVETDSVAFHSTAGARDRDARKDEAMREPRPRACCASGGPTWSIDPPKPPAASTKVVSIGHQPVEVTFVA